jgi:hypothetical protein
MVVLAVVVYGCGEEDSSAAEPLTKAQFLKQGNAICLRSEEERADAYSAKAKTLKDEGKKPTPKVQEELLFDILDPYERMIEKLTKLGAPKRDQKRVNAIVNEMEQNLAKANANPLALLSGAVSFEKADAMAKAYGLSSCRF